MFPLEFPLSVLRGRAKPGDVVLDPFCGRGTTNYASRLLGLATVGIDSSPVATALAESKLANVMPQDVTAAANEILEEITRPADIPQGEFWAWAFDPEVLQVTCRLREGLMRDCRTDARKALRAVVMGALHGPQPKTQRPSYLSNQCQRTYAPKPRYAVRFWSSRALRPPPVDVLDVVQRRAERYYGSEVSVGRGTVLMADSRRPESVRRAVRTANVGWVVSSPPYYGLDTYLPDQWLRFWFVGGPADVSYASPSQIDHTRPRQYVAQLRQVWRNAGAACERGARLVLRFGGINDRKAKPLDLAVASLEDTPWRLVDVHHAGSAARGKRQLLQFGRQSRRPLDEYDLWAELLA
jgi:DNA methylase